MAKTKAAAQTMLLATPQVLRVQENDASTAPHGGRIVLVADATMLGEMTEAPDYLQQVTVVLVYRRNEPMQAWPLTRPDRARRRFALAIYEGDPPEGMKPLLALPASLQVETNEREMDMHGGAIRLGLTDEARAELYDGALLSDVRVGLNYRRDEPMRAWPYTPEERIERRLSLAILES